MEVEKAFRAERHFHLHPLSQDSDPTVILLRFCHLDLKVNLKLLRKIFILANLVVLATGVFSFKTWATILDIKHETTKGLLPMEKAKDPFDMPHPWLHDHFHVLAHGFAHGDLVLFASGVILTGYYLVCGFIIPLKYGNSLINMSFVVLCAPPVICLAFYLFFFAWAFLQLRRELNGMDCTIVGSHVSYMRMNALNRLQILYGHREPALSCCYIAAAIVMICQSLLPFFMYDLPFQRKLDVEDFVLHYDPKRRATEAVPWFRPQQSQIIPYRNLSAAFTVMLQLCKPELRDFHRST